MFIQNCKLQPHFQQDISVAKNFGETPNLCLIGNQDQHGSEKLEIQLNHKAPLPE